MAAGLVALGQRPGWRASAALAHTNHLPVLPHYYKEYDVPLLMTVPNAYGAESFDWVDPLISRPVRGNGFAFPSPEPGWGFRFKDEHLTELASRLNPPGILLEGIHALLLGDDFAQRQKRDTEGVH